MRFTSVLPLIAVLAAGCATSENAPASTASELNDAASEAGLAEGTDAARGVLAVANDRRLTVDDYVLRVRISRVTAAAIIATRNGSNGVDESTAEQLGGDDEAFTKLSELDALPGTDEAAFRRLDAFARGSSTVVVSEGRLALGLHHGCAIAKSGALRCWGSNEWGQREAPAGTFRFVDSKGGFSCALDGAGKAKCWGERQGNEEATALLLNALPNAFLSVATGWSHTCGLGQDQRAYCWGNDLQGQAHPPETLFRQVTSGEAFSCGLGLDGAIACWGWDIEGATTPPSGAGFKQISGGYRHACALKSDDTIVCWGSNNGGQATPPHGTFRKVASGTFHGCALREDGSVTCWGENTSGEATPPAGPFVDVVANSRNTCGLRPTGTIACWGSNASGQAPRELVP